MRRLGLVPRSAKNRRRVVTVGGKPCLILSKEAKNDRGLIRDALLGCTKVPKDHDVKFVLRYLVAHDAIEWEVQDLGPRPKGRKGRQDLQGVVEALADAIQGYELENDSQISQIEAIKVYG